MIGLSDSCPVLTRCCAPMSKQQQRTSQQIVLLTIREAANLLRLTTRTIRRWIAEGRLNARRTHPGRGGRILLDRAEVLAAVGFSEAVSA